MMKLYRLRDDIEHPQEFLKWLDGQTALVPVCEHGWMGPHEWWNPHELEFGICAGGHGGWK